VCGRLPLAVSAVPAYSHTKDPPILYSGQWLTVCRREGIFPRTPERLRSVCSKSSEAGMHVGLAEENFIYGDQAVCCAWPEVGVGRKG